MSCKLISSNFLSDLIQDAVVIFERLAHISKFMEGEKYVLSSTLWTALKSVESELSPHLGDSVIIARLRAVMLQDHNTNRVTLIKSLQNPLHVLMHLLDPRLDSCSMLHSVVIHIIAVLLFLADSGFLVPLF